MKIIRSNRKFLALEIKPKEGLIVRVPLRATQTQGILTVANCVTVVAL
ncbi:MAG: hypothetical protein IKN30_01095 [Synergistaceae bacterium]|nr:hypothetical protein [Synergistaceae bacterium]